ncbi:glycosyltransferase [Microvirga antarctica]|uniref:glycosyltransferase n=1 Tax=Microvirga antarctica TaxID=2819233 RepID=UPI001B3113D3|nr:glycosyltransferase [Microvirga antarctica]
MSGRVLIVVTHLLGAGHLTRARALAGAFAASGYETTLVSGGMPMPTAPPPGVTFIQLPPVQVREARFSELLDERGAPVTVALLHARRALLRETVIEIAPAILITELFPLGRRGLADEFLALLRATRALDPRPLVLSSVRDILVAPAKPGRVAEAETRLDDFYDGILVHGDPALSTLDLSWPVGDRVRALIHETGYVDEDVAPVPVVERNGIVVSGGSSPAGLPLFRAALSAASIVPDHPWHVLVGRAVTEADFLALRQAAPAHVTVDRARPDFRGLLAGAEVSVSQAGYNTSIDLLRTGVRSVLVPFEGGRETEQRLRAERLQAAGLAHLLPESALGGPSLAQAVKVALASPLPPAATIALDGAARSVTIARRLGAPASHPSPINWSILSEAIARARGTGYEPAFWWRDDDAVAASPALDSLLQLSRRYDAPLALAVIPAAWEASLAERLLGESGVQVLVHGWAHDNHAPATAKKAEFGAHREMATMAAQAAAGLRKLESAFPAILPVFVPPWNRIAPALVSHLAEAGYAGLSTFRDRECAFPAPGLVQINTHVDPIDWHGSRSLAPVPELIAALASAIDGRNAGKAVGEPIGLLTHHLVHDAKIWAFCEELLAFLSRSGLLFGTLESYGVTTRETSSRCCALSSYDAPSRGEADG